MMGYYKNEADTREVLKDGWLHTGDIGRFDEDGFLIITDRKKDIIVTSGGKNIAPQPIESLIQASPYIASAVVVGSSRKFISALIVPDFEKLETLCPGQGYRLRGPGRPLPPAGGRRVPARRGQPDDARPGLLRTDQEDRRPRPRFRASTLGEVTPTLKVRRNIVEQKYADLIESLYRD